MTIERRGFDERDRERREMGRLRKWVLEALEKLFLFVICLPNQGKKVKIMCIIRAKQEEKMNYTCNLRYLAKLEVM